MSEDTRDTATCGDSLLPKPYSAAELQDVTSGLDDVDDKKALASPDAKAEVKFVSADSQNGDAIIDIDNVRAAFSGMGKEELMKFANDPFWVRTRWVLFVGFWVLWVAMVAGAIAIIILAPKCSSQPRRWWEQSPLYDVDSLSDDLAKVQGIESYLSRLSKIGVDGAILPPILNTGASSNPDAVVDFKAIKPEVGSFEDFRKSLKNIKEKGGHVIMEIALGHTSKDHEWFKQASKNDEHYKDYYVRVNTTVKNSLSPSEWGEDWKQGAFMANTEGSTFYLRQSADDLPVLNLTNPAVVAEIEGIMRFWLDAGVSGFQIRQASNIFSADWINLPKGTLLRENQTSQGVSIIKKLHAAVTNHTKDNVLILRGDILSAFQDKKITGLSDVLNSPISLFTLQDGFTAAQLKDKLERPINESATKWPLWEISDSSVKSSVLPPSLMNGLLMTTMLLPGTLVVHKGSLLDIPAETNTSSGAVPTVTESPKTVIQRRTEIFKELASVRKNMDSVNFGRTNATLVNGSNAVIVFTLTRIKSGNPGVLVVLNPSSINTSVNLSGLDKVPEELTVHSLSFEVGEDISMQPKSKLPSTEIKLPGKSAVVFTFVPKKDG